MKLIFVCFSETAVKLPIWSKKCYLLTLKASTTLPIFMCSLTVVVVLIIPVNWLPMWNTGLRDWLPWRSCSVSEVISAQFYLLMTVCTRSVPSHGASQANLSGTTAELQVCECYCTHLPFGAESSSHIDSSSREGEALFTYIHFTISRPDTWGYVYNIAQVNSDFSFCFYSSSLISFGYRKERSCVNLWLRTNNVTSMSETTNLVIKLF